MLYYNVVLPVEGSPYIEGSAQPDGGELETLQKIVGGRIESVSRLPWTIHPMFLGNKRWGIAEVMRKTKGVKMYVNEEGMYHCSPNMATMITGKRDYLSGCPHLLGDIALVVPVSIFITLKINPECLKLTHDPDVYVAGPEEEDEDEPDIDEEDEEEKATLAMWKEKGYEYVSGAGQLYKAKA